MEAPEPSRVPLQPSSMRDGSVSELEELLETPGGKITHLRSHKAEAVVFGLPPARLRGFQLKYRLRAPRRLGAASPLASPGAFIFFAEESPLHQESHLLCFAYPWQRALQSGPGSAHERLRVS